MFNNYTEAIYNNLFAYYKLNHSSVTKFMNCIYALNDFLACFKAEV